MLTSEQQIFEQIKKASNILVTFSMDWNGDAVASSLALFMYLKKIGKNVDLIAQATDQNELDLQAPNKLFSFLPQFNQIGNSLDNLRKFVVSIDISNAKINQIKYKLEKNTLNFIISPKEGFFTHNDISSSSSGFKYDLVITIDTPDLESLGKIYDNNTEFFYKTSIINIDHHSGNEEYGQINFIDLNALSTSEILFSIFKQHSKNLIDEDIATCLLTGIIYKTKSFKTPNITPNTLLTTSQLISMGARREEIVNRLYRSRNLSVLKLWGRVLARLNGEMDNKLVWSTVSKLDFQKTNSNEENLSDVVDELITNIPQAKVVVIMHEESNGKIENNNGLNGHDEYTSVVVYSIKNINSLDLLKEYNPIGTKKIAKAKIKKSLNDVEKEVIENIKEKLSKISME